MKKKELIGKFEEYVIEYKEPIYRLAYSYTRNADDALDIVQESIYKGISSIDSLKDFGAVKTWFYRIIVNTSLDFIRKRNREITVDEEFLFDNEISDYDDYPDIDLERAMENLPDIYRTIIILRYFEDLKIDEIAQVLNINANTVKTRLYRGLELLRINMEEEEAQI